MWPLEYGGLKNSIYRNSRCGITRPKRQWISTPYDWLGQSRSFGEEWVEGFETSLRGRDWSRVGLRELEWRQGSSCDSYLRQIKRSSRPLFRDWDWRLYPVRLPFRVKRPREQVQSRDPTSLGPRRRRVTDPPKDRLEFQLSLSCPSV